VHSSRLVRMAHYYDPMAGGPPLQQPYHPHPQAHHRMSTMTGGGPPVMPGMPPPGMAPPAAYGAYPAYPYPQPMYFPPPASVHSGHHQHAGGQRPQMVYQNPNITSWLNQTPLPLGLEAAGDESETEEEESEDEDSDEQGRRRRKKGQKKRSHRSKTSSNGAVHVAPGRSNAKPLTPLASGNIPAPLPAPPPVKLGEVGLYRDRQSVAYDPTNPIRVQPMEDGRAVRKAGAVSKKQMKHIKEMAKRIEKEEAARAKEEEEGRLDEASRKWRSRNDDSSSESSGGDGGKARRESRRSVIVRVTDSEDEEAAKRVVKRVSVDAKARHGEKKRGSSSESDEALPSRKVVGRKVPATVANLGSAEAMREFLFVTPGRNRTAPAMSSTKAAAETRDTIVLDKENDEESGSSDERPEDSDNESEDGEEEQEEDAVARMKSMNLGRNRASAAVDDEYIFSDDEDDGRRPRDHAPPPPLQNIYPPADTEDDDATLVAELEEKRLQCKRARQEPESSLDAARHIIENAQRAYFDPGLQKHLCAGAVKCLQKVGSLPPSACPPDVAAEAQHLLANLYVSGVPGFQERHKPDYVKAFVLYSSAAKKDHADATFHVALCYEQGAGVSANNAKAVHNYKKAARKNHPGAMLRLGMAVLRGELSQHKNLRDGIKWLRLAAKYADERYPQALYELAMLHDSGDGNNHIVWSDHAYVVELLTRGAELGHAKSQYKLGQAYELGMYGCALDAARSVYYYSLAAENDHAEAMFELGGWYLTGASDPNGSFTLPQSDVEARRWVSRAAEMQLPRAMFAMGYFIENGIGADPKDENADHGPDPDGALLWYRRAAADGDEKAKKRLEALGIKEAKERKTVVGGMMGGSGTKSTPYAPYEKQPALGDFAPVPKRVVSVRRRRQDLDEELDGGNKCLIM
ncbi:hypothetical protein HK101_010632, partial [Irineochytrium annulatum]